MHGYAPVADSPSCGSAIARDTRRSTGVELDEHREAPSSGTKTALIEVALCSRGRATRSRCRIPATRTTTLRSRLPGRSECRCRWTRQGGPSGTRSRESRRSSTSTTRPIRPGLQRLTGSSPKPSLSPTGRTERSCMTSRTANRLDGRRRRAFSLSPEQRGRRRALLLEELRHGGMGLGFVSATRSRRAE